MAKRRLIDGLIAGVVKTTKTLFEGSSVLRLFRARQTPKVRVALEVQLIGKHGEGGFADVYEATDALGRSVAVKIVRASAAVASSALEHARALARLDHPNVVAVYSIEKVIDPETGNPADGIVMEFLAGPTLTARLRAKQLTQEEARAVGLGVLSGLRHIHAAGMTHGDLHSDNVILVGTAPKIIDVLYRESLALLSKASKEVQLRRDILSVRMILYDILLTSELDPAEATEFNRLLSQDATLEDVCKAFEAVVEPSRRANDDLRIEQSIQRVWDEAYVEGGAYAAALAAETPAPITVALLSRLISDGGVLVKHRPYVKLLWERLTTPEKRIVCSRLSESIQKEVPKGSWASPLQMLAAFGKEGWENLPHLVQLRLEGAITNDILAGHFDIYGTNLGNPGALGTWAQTFWSNFSNIDAVIENLIARMQSGWYGQNYVGKYFLWLIPAFGNTRERRARLLSAVAYAVRNDAKLVDQNLFRLPRDWQDAIASEANPKPDPDPFTDDDIPF